MNESLVPGVDGAHGNYFRVADDTPGTAGRHIRAYRVRPCERAAALGLCQA